MEKAHLKFCKFSLGTGKRSSNLAVMGELGRYPIYTDVIVNMFSYLNYLHNSDDVLLNEALLLSKTLSQENKNSWYNSMKSIAHYLNIY